jgi:hypothetical protein
LVLGIAGYQWYTQNKADNQKVAVGNGSVEGGTATLPKHDYSVNFPADNNSKSVSQSKTGTSKSQATTNSNEPFLKPAGGRNLKSPAGLIYTGGREHRTDHVLRHAKDIPDRQGSHGVFHANGDDVFRLIDEAYELVKSKSKQVKTTPSSGGKTEYVIDMKRKIGYKGGQSGKRANHPDLYKVKLILGDNRVITAYPY